jgi:hypothetical protein
MGLGFGTDLGLVWEWDLGLGWDGIGMGWDGMGFSMSGKYNRDCLFGNEVFYAKNVGMCTKDHIISLVESEKKA